MVEVIVSEGIAMEGKKEGNVLFNHALNTFYLRIYGKGSLRSTEKRPAAATWDTLSD